MKFPEVSGGSNAKHLLKLKNAESAKGVFRGDPHVFRQHWGNGMSALCTGNNCVSCADGSKPSFRFRINFLTNENGAYIAKVLEQGRRVYDALKALNEDFDLEKTIVKITRFGDGKENTTYQIMPIKDSQVGKELEEKLAAIAVHDLGAVKGHPAPDFEDKDDNDEVPF